MGAPHSRIMPCMEIELLNQGFTLLLAGMGTVFVFLTALVIAMTLMSRVINYFQSQSSPSGATEEEVAAIGAAISRHRSQ